MLRRLPVLGTLIAVLFAGSILIGAQVASADSGPCISDGSQGSCTGSGSTTGSGGNGGTSSGGVCMDNNATDQGYPCSGSGDGLSWWYVGAGCYSAQVPTALWPPVGDPAWTGHTAADNGIIVYRNCSGTLTKAPPTYMTWERCIVRCATFSPLTVQAELKMQAPVIKTAPDAAAGKAFVNQNVWMWAANDMADHTITEWSGPNVIVATRTLTNMTIDWKDGTDTLTSWPNCRVYQTTDGNNPAPAHCGHVYKNPGKYQITVSVTWVFSYTFNGVAGQGATLSNLVQQQPPTLTVQEGQSTNG